MRSSVFVKYKQFKLFLPISLHPWPSHSLYRTPSRVCKPLLHLNVLRSSCKMRLAKSCSVFMKYTTNNSLSCFCPFYCTFIHFTNCFRILSKFFRVYSNCRGLKWLNPMMCSWSAWSLHVPPNSLTNFAYFISLISSAGTFKVSQHFGQFLLFLFHSYHQLVLPEFPNSFIYFLLILFHSSSASAFRVFNTLTNYCSFYSTQIIS